jgi:hypothetical protein
VEKENPPSPSHKNHFQMNKDLNVKCKILKSLRKKTTLWPWVAKKFFKKTQVEITKGKTDEFDYIKIKAFCSSKDTINNPKSCTTNLGKIFAIHM